MELSKRRILVTAALPYANYELHIAHARSTYIPADIYVRYQRLKGNEVYYVCGTDEHGTPISVEAEKEGVSPKDIAYRYYKLDVEDFERLGISFDNFSRTTREIHYETAQWFFKTLYDNGHIYSKTIVLPYCPTCGRFLPDRFVIGTCPYCGFEEARGDECENCDRALTVGELLDPRCRSCGNPAEERESEHWFLRLSAFENKLRKWIEEEDPISIYGKQYIIRQYLDAGLTDICISRDLDWGVPVPLEKAKGKVLYVWFENVIGYVDSTKELSRKIGKTRLWEDFWLKEEDVNTELVHFIGKGIIYHHSLLWPAILMGCGYKLPDVIPTYAYGNLEGKPMSKGRRWYIALREFIQAFGPDSLRYYWLAVSPLTEDADFNWTEFEKRYNDELADVLGNFVHRALMFVDRFFEKKIPEAVEYDEYDHQIEEHINETQKAVSESIERFEFRSGLLSIMNLARVGNKYLNDKEPWATVRTDPEKAKTAINICVRIVKAFAVLLEPYLPFTAERIWNMLNFGGSVHEKQWDIALEDVSAGHEIETPKPLFIKLEKDHIEAQRKKVLQRLKDADMPGEKISVEEFAKLDIRVGKIVEAERVRNSDKLVRLEVDIGERIPRQIVAGILPQYKPEDLMNKRIVILANLKPIKVRNIRSEGMLLAVIDEGKIVLLTLDKDAKPGARIG
ncbi:MAG: methionine--tRNA ligase [Promethearchaeota archaeon]